MRLTRLMFWRSRAHGFPRACPFHVKLGRFAGETKPSVASLTLIAHITRGGAVDRMDHKAEEVSAKSKTEHKAQSMTGVYTAIQ